MKRYSLQFLFVLLSCAAFSQDTLTLTRPQMRADFDSLTSTLKRVSPHIPLKKVLWKYDALKEMGKLRKQLCRRAGLVERAIVS